MDCHLKRVQTFQSWAGKECGFMLSKIVCKDSILLGLLIVNETLIATIAGMIWVKTNIIKDAIVLLMSDGFAKLIYKGKL